MKDADYNLHMASIAVIHAIEHLDGARAQMCADGTPDKAVLVSIAGYQGALEAVRDEINKLRRSLQ